jgi:hypothetical protein
LTRTIDEEVVILDRCAGQVHQLNVTASYIWNNWDGVQSAADIAARVAGRFHAAPDTVLSDVLATVAQLEQLGLLVDED